MKLRAAVAVGFAVMAVASGLAASSGQWAAIFGPLWFMVGIGYYHAKMDEL